MKVFKNKITLLAVSLIGFGTLTVGTMAQAGCYNHHWHKAGRQVTQRGCHRVVRQRFCRRYHGYRQCYVVRHSHWTC